MTTLELLTVEFGSHVESGTAEFTRRWMVQGEDGIAALTMDLDSWEALGEPRTITVEVAAVVPIAETEETEETA